jgi:hypothetical protein
MKTWKSAVVASILTVLAMPGALFAQGITDMKKGEGGSVVQGSAGPTGSQGGTDLERSWSHRATSRRRSGGTSSDRRCR